MVSVVEYSQGINVQTITGNQSLTSVCHAVSVSMSLCIKKQALPMRISLRNTKG